MKRANVLFRYKPFDEKMSRSKGDVYMTETRIQFKEPFNFSDTLKFKYLSRFLMLKLPLKIDVHC